MLSLVVVPVLFYLSPYSSYRLSSSSCLFSMSDETSSRAALTFTEAISPGVKFEMDLKRILASEESEFQKVDIIETVFGKVCMFEVEGKLGRLCFVSVVLRLTRYHCFLAPFFTMGQSHPKLHTHTHTNPLAPTVDTRDGRLHTKCPI